MKIGFRVGLLAIYLCATIACTSRSNIAAAPITSAMVYLAAQGNSSVQAFNATLSSGVLNPSGNTLATGSIPVSIALTPSLNAMFVSNSGSDNISSFTINSDGSLTASSSNAIAAKAGTRPTGIAVDPAGKFLFVANQGSSNISVYSINGTALTQVAGSPFTTIIPGTTEASNPSAVVVSPSGNFLYVANSFTGTVSAYSIGSGGALKALGTSPYTVGLTPSGLDTVPGGGFLYVANSGSNNVSAFAICDKVTSSCADPTNPDGTLTPVAGSPFSAGIGPVAIAADPSFNFLYVVNKQSGDISEFSFAPGSGVLSPLGTPSISSGLTPLSLVIIAGATGTNLGNTFTNPTDFLFVSNNGASTITTFSLSTSSGILNPIGTPYTVPAGNPTAVAAN